MAALNEAGTSFEFIMEEEEPERIDKLLSSMLPDLSRSYLQKLVKEGAVLVNKKEVKPNHKVNPGDVVESICSGAGAAGHLTGGHSSGYSV